MNHPTPSILPLAISFFTAIIPAFAAETGTQLAPERLKEIPRRMEAFVGDGTIAGAVTLVARREGPAAIDAVGYADLAARKPMRPDDLFWIASMTKPITATAVMMLRDAGKLSVDDPVDRHLPEFRDLWVEYERAPDRLLLHRPTAKLTLRHLLTHTSGLADAPETGRELTLAERVLCSSQRPLRFEPGVRWEYSNAGINALGRVVEIASGMPYAEFLESRIFEPLGMRDTTFWPTPAQAERIARSYEPARDGKGLVEAPNFFLRGDVTSRTRPPFPAGGLFSTAADLLRFYRMVLSGGTFEGRRLVSREAVEEMTRTGTGDLKTGFTEGMSFGLGWAVLREPTGVTAMLSPGTFGHGGAYGTQGWIDPKKDLILILMIQRAKLPNADASDVRRAFQEAAAAALSTRPF